MASHERKEQAEIGVQIMAEQAKVAWPSHEIDSGGGLEKAEASRFFVKHAARSFS